MPRRSRSARQNPWLEFSPHVCCRQPIRHAIHRPKLARMRPRSASSSWTPTSVSRRFPTASKNTNVVLPTPWRSAKASPSGVLRSARTNATCPRNSGRSASTTRLSWAQFGQPGKNTCTIAGCLPMTSKPLYPGWLVSTTTATTAATAAGAAMNNVMRRRLRLCRRAIACCRAALRLCPI